MYVEVAVTVIAIANKVFGYAAIVKQLLAIAIATATATATKKFALVGEAVKA
jgi:recombination DNA repair RAD52 pathway protein